jgi:5-methylcytosine-specific restriction endonuclease McrA
MKICWDNLEKLTYNKKTGKWYDNRYITYIYKDKCKNCGEPFLTNSKGAYCCKSCSKTGKNNPFYGRHHTEDARRRISEHSAIVGGDKHPMYGRHHTEEAKKRISESSRGKNSNFWKGGVTSKNLPLYDTYAHQIDWCDAVRRNENDPNILEVQCAYCGKWFIPRRWDVLKRAQYLKGNWSGENLLYCSDTCKSACPLYRRKPETLMKEDAVRAGRIPWVDMNREVQPEIRQMVLERDNYECQKCGTIDKPLHCHHILPVAIEPLLSADIDNCITLCEECHKQVHKLPGCGYGEIRTCI